MKKCSFWLIILIVLIPAGLLGASFNVNMEAAPMSSGDLSALKAALEKDGFTVQEGQFIQFDVLSMCCTGQIPSCLGFNPIAPYMSARLPKAPGQTVESTFPWVFRLGANEAVIVVGRTPPPTAYFSYDTYAITRFSEKEQAHKVIFSNLGDTFSHLTIHTSGTVQEPFNRDVMIIYTADQGIDSRVRSAARTAGYPTSIINTGVIPDALTRLGTDEKADEIGIVHRMALPQTGSEKALADYLKTPQLLLRVTLKNQTTPDPFPMPTLRAHGTGRTEMDLMPAVEDLRKAILEKHGKLKATELTTGLFPGQEFDCLQREINGYGPTRDALYLMTTSVFKLPDSADDFVIIYGVNHEAVGKATYASLNVYEDSMVAGISGEHNRHYAGSAKDYLPNHPQADLLYVWKIARNCRGEPHCLEAQISNCPKIDLNKLPNLEIFWRLYVERETRVAPAPGEVIYDQAILFSPAGSTPTVGVYTWDWQTYIVGQARSSFRIPLTWRSERVPDQAGGTIHGIALKGPEGGVEVYWGAALGGTCAGETQKIQIARGEISACYTKRADGTVIWDQMTTPLDSTSTTTVSARAYTNNAASTSYDVVRQVLSQWVLPP